MRSPNQVRPTRALDMFARMVAAPLSRRQTARVDQGRRDITMLVDRARGQLPATYRTPSEAPATPPALEDVDWLDLLPRSLARRVDTWRRDTRVLRDRLAGRGLPPTVARPPKAKLADLLTLHPETAQPAAEAQSGTSQIASLSSRPLTITKVVQETADAYSLYLTEADGSPIQFRAGQFLSFDVEVDGVLLRRAYSLASLPGRDAFITIKRIPDGRVSNALAQVTQGESLNALGPSGEFGANLVEDMPEHLVLIAGGSGITPLMSIAETTLRTQSASIALVYGSRDLKSIIFRERLEALQVEFPKRLRVQHVLDSNGHRLDATTIRRELDALDCDSSNAHYYVCGPTPVLDAARDVLIELPSEHVHEERFASPADPAPKRASGPSPITIRAKGQQRQLVSNGETLLEAGLAAGIDMPFSCAMGGCAACKVKLVEGDVDMDEPNCLTRAERDAGYVLACISRASGPCCVEVES